MGTTAQGVVGGEGVNQRPTMPITRAAMDRARALDVATLAAVPIDERPTAPAPEGSDERGIELDIINIPLAQILANVAGPAAESFEP